MDGAQRSVRSWHYPVSKAGSRSGQGRSHGCRAAVLRQPAELRGHVAFQGRPDFFDGRLPAYSDFATDAAVANHRVAVLCSAHRYGRSFQRRLRRRPRRSLASGAERFRRRTRRRVFSSLEESARRCSEESKSDFNEVRAGDFRKPVARKPSRMAEVRRSRSLAVAGGRFSGLDWGGTDLGLRESS